MTSNLFSSTTLTKFKNISLKATIILLATSAIVAIITILISGNEFTFKILATTLLLSLFSLISTNNILRLSSEQKIVKITAASALIADIIWILPLLFMLWGPIPGYTVKTRAFWTFVWQITLTGLTIAIASTIASKFICFYRTKNSAIQALASLTIISSTVLSLLWLTNIWFMPSIGLPWQLYTIFFIFLVFGTIITPILAKVKHIDAHQTNQPPLNQEELRAQIEREVRAQIAAEQATKQKPKQPTA